MPNVLFSPFSANYELSEDQLLNIIEEIFSVNLMAGSADGSRMTLTQVSELVTEQKRLTSSLNFKEIVSDVLMEVLVSLSNGMLLTYFTSSAPLSSFS